jgi:L-ascorbate metabolism protein UlaG (beta-lactamase superfamily)
MKRSISLCLFVALITALVSGCAPAATVTATPTAIPPTATPIPPTPTLSPQDGLAKLHWFGTSAFLYNGSRVIYFDPITLGGNLPKADLVLVTHAHTDHWSVADLQKIIGPDTMLVIGTNVSQSYEAAKDALGIPATVLNEGDKTEVAGVSIEAVPAFDTTFHQKGTGGVGFLVTVDGLIFYHAGGTDAYPEMADYKCDIAFVPVYSKNQAQAIVDVLPAKVIIFEHTSYYAAAAVANLFNPVYGPDKMFAAMEAGPYNP